MEKVDIRILREVMKFGVFPSKFIYICYIKMIITMH
jgi:hypothetical protein